MVLLMINLLNFKVIFSIPSLLLYSLTLYLLFTAAMVITLGVAADASTSTETITTNQTTEQDFEEVSLTYKYFPSYGNVPMEIDGIAQELMRELTICASTSISSFHVSSSNPEWVIENEIFDELMFPCKNIELILRPTIGENRVSNTTLKITGMSHSRAIEETIDITANLIDSHSYKQHLSKDVYYTGEVAAKYSVQTNSQPVLRNSDQQLWLVGSSFTDIFSINPDRTIHFLTESSYANTNDEVICDAQDNLLHFSLGKIRLFNSSGSALDESESHVVTDGNSCGALTNQQIRIESTCRGNADVSGRVEMRDSNDNNWRSMCAKSVDIFPLGESSRWGTEEATVICNSLGFFGQAVARCDCIAGEGEFIPKLFHCNGTEGNINACESRPHYCTLNMEAYFENADNQEWSRRCIRGAGETGDWEAGVNCNRLPSIVMAGCPNFDEMHQSLLISNGCTAYSLVELDSGFWNAEGQNVPTSHDISTRVHGQRPLGYFSLDPETVLFTRPSGAFMIRMIDNVFENEETAFSLPGDALITTIDSRMYFIARTNSGEQSFLGWVGIGQNNTDFNNTQILNHTSIEQPVKLEGADNGIIAISNIAGSVFIFMEIDEQRGLPGLRSVNTTMKNDNNAVAIAAPVTFILVTGVIATVAIIAVVYYKYNRCKVWNITPSSPNGVELEASITKLNQ